MARLTWQNVEAPDLGQAANILNAAASQIGSAGSTISGAARNARQDYMDRKSAEILPILAGVTGSGDVAGALAKINPADLNEEARKAYMGLMGTGLGFDKDRVSMDATRASTEAVRGAEGRAGTEFNRRITREDQAAAAAAGLVAAAEGAYYGPQGGRGANGLPDNERDLLAMTLQAEAGGEGYQGMLAAGSVVANRVKSGKYGVGFGGVITRPGQFSYLNGVTGYAGGEGAIDPSNIKISPDAYAAADAIMSGQYQDPTGGATHYYNDKVANPAWGASKAGGDWIRIGNHVFGSPDGKPGTGSNANPVSGMIPENNALPPEFWLGQVDDNFTREGAGYDRERSRMADAESDLAKQAIEAGRKLAEDTARMTERPQDMNAIISQSDAPPEVRAAALDYSQSPEIQGLFELTTEQRELAIDGGVAATTSLDVDTAMLNDVKKNNPTLRIQSNAENYGKDPALTLAQELGNETDDGKSLAMEAINKTVLEAKNAGITLSPGEAAALLKETSYRAGIGSSNWALMFGGDQWGNVYADPEAAVAMAKQHMSPMQKQKGAELLSQITRAEGENAGLRDRMAAEQAAWQLAQSRGDTEDAAKYETRFKEAVEAANSLAGTRSFFPKGETPAPLREAGEGGATGSWNTAEEKVATTPTADPLGAANLQIANSTLEAATGGVMSLDKLALAPPEQQVEILQGVIDELVSANAPEAQIMSLEAILSQIMVNNNR